MFHGAGTVIINGGSLTMIVISKFGCFFIAFHQCTYIKTAPTDAGNPTQNRPQEGVSATTGTTSSRTSETNEGPDVAI